MDDPFPKGPPRWQFNASLLKDQDFVEHMNVFISNFLDDPEHGDIDCRTKWELLKAGIRLECIFFGRSKQIKKDNELENKFKLLNNIVTQNPTNQEYLKQLEECKKRLEIKELAKTRGAIVRSRTKWVEQGEKNTKYFLNIEKRRASNNLIKQLKNEAHEVIKDPHEILEEIRKYYEHLYAKDAAVEKVQDRLDDFLVGITHNVLTEEDKHLCDAEINLNEMGEALKQLNDNSAPGSDGLTADFYKVFWRALNKPLLESYKRSLELAELSTLKEEA
ncbi:LINE-1 reverse transcriptase homolog [Elysia marginata]|uniref:LINE-1 reverse transcriptase homolog n=1 Tax=Elysia marginata TaxID=1093978 RepID=A0AAV4G6V9_9GAST|nr:LINE-1 reverse transcriptase homolog [Elysia marginata]